ARFGVADIAQHLLKAVAVELAGDALEARRLSDLAGDLGIADVEPQRASAVVEGGLGDDLAQQLPVEAQRPRLIRQDRPVQLPPKLLHPVLVELAKRIDADFRAADRGNGGGAEAAKDVADAPDAK